MDNRKNFFIGIAGGTGSGKTFLANGLAGSFATEVVILNQDNYYKPIQGLNKNERDRINFDHPDSVDFKLLYRDIHDLIAGKPTLSPVWDFSVHDRKEDRLLIEPCQIIILEGIFALFDKYLRRLMDLKIFMELNSDLRFIRRLIRDINERGRSVTSVIKQYLTTVRPMHNKYVEPNRKVADLILSGNKPNRDNIKIINSYIIKNIRFDLSFSDL